MVERRKWRKEQKCNHGTLSFHMNVDQWHFSGSKIVHPFVCLISEMSLNSVVFLIGF